MVLSNSKNKGKLGLKVGAKCVGEAEGIKQGPKQCEGYCQLKSNWADFLPRVSNLNAEQSRSDECVYGLIFGQIPLS